MLYSCKDSVAFAVFKVNVVFIHNMNDKFLGVGAAEGEHLNLLFGDLSFNKVLIGQVVNFLTCNHKYSLIIFEETFVKFHFKRQ